jgi:hypothetical protein
VGGDVYLVKADASGNQQWYKTFGGVGWEAGYSVQQTADGGYVIAGGTNSYGVNGDVRLIKTDASGDSTWTRTFGDSATQYCYSGQQTADGGYIMAGTHYWGVGSADVYLVKADANGKLTWSHTYGGPDEDWGRSVWQTADGGYIIAGNTASYGAGNADVYLIKTDANGDLAWYKTYGGPGWDDGYSVQQTADGGYIIVGYTASGGAEPDVYLIKTDAGGNQTWFKTFGGSAADYGWSVQQTADGGYIITGQTDSYGAGSADVYLIKTDASGNQTWYKTFGGSAADRGWSVQQTTDGGYIITGETNSYGAGSADVYLIKTDADGNVE